MKLSELFSNNYKYLNTVAVRITRSKDYRMAPDLLSETYVSVEKLNYPQENDEFVKWFSKCMKNYFKWPNSSFNKLYAPKESLTLDVGFYEKNGRDRKHKIRTSIEDGIVRADVLIIDESALRDIEVLVEDTNDFTRELIGISSNLGNVKTLKYIELVDFKRSLPAHENILFELYFEKELSTREIADLYSSPVHKMNYQSVNQMVNKIKEKIKSYQWKS